MYHEIAEKEFLRSLDASTNNSNGAGLGIHFPADADIRARTSRVFQVKRSPCHTVVLQAGLLGAPRWILAYRQVGQLDLPDR